MAHDLLSTKLRIPPRTQHVVRRARLVDALGEAVPRHKLALISAPAGYGKTTLLADWARESRLPVAWLSLGADDNDLERFLRYLLTAWEGASPGVEDSPLGLLLGGMMPDRDAVLTAFVNVANELPGQIVFVLDDFHLIEDGSIHEALAFLLDHLPPTVHFALAGRGEPPLPLARYRARQELFELDASDLQFRVEETDAFLNQQMGLRLDDDAVTALHAQLEGWIAGTQMAALTLRRQDRPAEHLIVSGRHRFIADYLSQDVLAHLPDDLRQFLLRTSVLDRLSGPLCDAVTGEEDARTTLETLERENLFLVPLDDNREWYRYHRLFADFLRDELQRRHPDEVAGLHRRAGNWCLAHDLPEPAFQHALAGDDLELMIRVCERHIFVKLHNGEFRLLQHWLSALPAEWYSAYPVFGLARAGLFAFSGALEDCVRCVDDVEHQLVLAERTDSRGQLARVTALRCFVACFQNDLAQAEILASQALQNLRDDDVSFRLDIYHALGDTYRRNGRWDDAKANYRKVLDLTHSPTFPPVSPHIFGALADLDLRQGRLRNAAAHWRQALAVIQERESWGRIPLPVIGWVYLRMGEILYEWNRLADAWDHLSRGLERAELGGDVRAMIVGYLLAGRVALTEGDSEAAAEYLEEARPLVEQASFPEWTSRFERLRLELWLAQGRLRAAVDWSDEMLKGDALRDRP
ncbi:MAG: AAA family ATPase, partial [Thermomicrobiales bacterium]